MSFEVCVTNLTVKLKEEPVEKYVYWVFGRIYVPTYTDGHFKWGLVSMYLAGRSGPNRKSETASHFFVVLKDARRKRQRHCLSLPLFHHGVEVTAITIPTIHQRKDKKGCCHMEIPLGMPGVDGCVDPRYHHAVKAVSQNCGQQHSNGATTRYVGAGHTKHPAE